MFKRVFPSRPREVRKRLPGERLALCQSGDWLGIRYVLGFGASALFTAQGRGLNRWCELSIKPANFTHAPNLPTPWPYAAGGVRK